MPDGPETMVSPAEVDAVGAAIEAALDALDDALDGLYLTAAEGGPVVAAAEGLAAIADRVAEAAAGWVLISQPPPEPEPDPAALLTAAGDALDAALALLDGLGEPPEDVWPTADRARLAERIRRAAVALSRAARTVTIFGLDLDAFAAPPAFRTPQPPAQPAPDGGPRPRAADRITTVALDPDRAFVAWTITAAGFARASEALLADEPPALTLRVYVEAAGEPPLITDHPIDSWQGQTTMEIDDRGGALLVCAIGLAAGGTFAHIARATAVQLPRATPGDAPPRFARVAPDADGRLQIEPMPAETGPEAMPVGEPGVAISALLASGGAR